MQNDGPPDELKTFQADLVAGIRAGKLDKTKLHADYTAIDAASTARGAKHRCARGGDGCPGLGSRPGFKRRHVASRRPGGPASG